MPDIESNSSHFSVSSTNSQCGWEGVERGYECPQDEYSQSMLILPRPPPHLICWLVLCCCIRGEPTASVAQWEKPLQPAATARRDAQMQSNRKDNNHCSRGVNTCLS